METHEQTGANLNPATVHQICTGQPQMYRENRFPPRSVRSCPTPMKSQAGWRFQKSLARHSLRATQRGLRTGKQSPTIPFPTKRLCFFLGTGSGCAVDSAPTVPALNTAWGIFCCITLITAAGRNVRKVATWDNPAHKSQNVHLAQRSTNKVRDRRIGGIYMVYTHMDASMSRT